MMNETFDRPNRATGPREVWECDNGLMFITHDSTGGLRLKWKESGGIFCECAATVCPPGRYRIRTLDEKPWPPKTRIEKRRVVLAYDPDSCTEKVFYLRDHENITARFTIRLDEIRDCEIEDGKVVRVLKEGE